MTPPKKLLRGKKVKTVKAWAVVDPKNDILHVGTKIEDGVFKGPYMINSDQADAERQWQPFKVIPCTISYVI